MKPAIVLVGEDSLALASLRQHLEKEPRFSVEKKIQGFAETLESLHKLPDPVVAVVDLNWDSENTLRAIEELKLKFPQLHLVLTAAENNSLCLARRR